MGKVKKTIYIALIAIIVIVALLFCYLKFYLPQVGKAETIKVEITPERVERGKYLANSVFACMDCHSKRNWDKFAGPLVENTLGQGGEEFGKDEGLPGNYYAKNITPFELKNWTDGEILRAISTGVDNDGDALFPIMPYLNYGKLDREDLYCIIAYIRTIPAINHNIPESESDFPVNLLLNTMPQKANFTKIPDKTDKISYGKYIFTAASCVDCHTKLDKGKPVSGMDLAGGFRFPLKTGGFVSSANITPDMETGIGKWSEENFLNRFKVYTDSSYVPATINKGDFNTIMPWMMFSTMKEEDLKAVYAYLRTIKPIRNLVVKFTTE